MTRSTRLIITTQNKYFAIVGNAKIQSKVICMSQQKNTLLKVIVNKSHFEDRLVEVKSDGHTLFTGENGDGKSTTLSLYGAFYGAEPSKLVDRDAGKLPFVKYYLPQSKSFIAYEYLKKGQSKVAFIYKNGSNGIAYRFADISAEELLSKQNISALDNDYGSTRDWLSQHIKKQVHVSQPITTTQDYRCIIQNNRSQLGKRRNSNGQLLTIAQRYSLCDPEHSMLHIDVLVSTMMRNNNMLENFRRMITDAFIAPKVSLSKSPYNKADIDHLDALKAIRELEKHKKTFDNALMLSQRMDDLYTEAANVLNQMLSKCDSEIQRRAEISEQLDVAQKRLREFTEKAEIRRLELNESLNDIRRNLQSIDRDLTSIHQKRERFEIKECIQKVISERDQSEVIRAQHRQALDHLKILRKGFESEEKQLESELQKLDNQHLKMANEIYRKVDLHKEEFRKFQDDTKAVVKQAESEHLKNITEINKKYRNLSLEAAANLSDARIGVERAGNITLEQKNELESYQRKINSIRDDINEEHQNLNVANDKVISLTKIHESLLNDIDTAVKTKASYQAKINKIQELLNPASNTFAAFLNNEVADWKSTVGKTINPALLSNTKLSPQLGDHYQYNQHLIHGIELDLSSVNSEFFREEEQLIDDLQTLEAKIASTTKTEKEHIRQAREAYSELSGFKQMVLVANDVINKHNENVKRFQLQLDNNKQVFAEEARDRVVEAKKFVNECELRVSQTSTAHDDNIANVTNTYNNTILQIESDATLKESEIEAAIDGLEESAKKDKKVTNQRKSHLKAVHADKLKSDGIDPAVISEAREVVAQLEYRIDCIDKSHDLISEYNTWLAKDWSRVDTLTREEKDLNDREQEAVRLIGSHTKKKAEDETKHNVVITQLNKEKNRCNTNIDELEKAATRLKDIILQEYVTKDASLEIVSVDVVISQSSDLVKQISSNRDAIIKSVDKVTEVLSELGTTNDISQFWEEVKRKRKQELAQNSPEKAFGSDLKVALLPSLDQLINVVIPEKQSIILEAIRSVSMKYSNFYLTLEDTNKKIRAVSNLLGRSVGTSNPFPAIEEVQLGVVSKIEKFESWDSLGTFNNEWEKWAEAITATVPSDAFIKTFESAYRSLSLLKLNTSLSSLVDLEIRMTENGTQRTIRNDSDLAGVSSEGISKLAVIVVFCGMVRYLCPDPQTIIHWPVDELGKISLSNTRLLFNMMSDKGITLITAEPNYRREMLKYYVNKLHIDRRYGVMTYVDVRKNRDSSRLFSVVNTQSEKEA